MGETDQILIVGGGSDFRETLADQLKEQGYEPLLAQTVGDGLDVAARNNLGGIVMDIQVSDVSAAEGVRRFKAKAPQLPVMIMADRGVDQTLSSDAMGAGADGVLYKPFDVSAVLTMLTPETVSTVDGQEIEGSAVVDLRGMEIDPQALQLVPEEMARKYQVLPLRLSDGELVVAMADPHNLHAIEDLWVLTRKQVRPVPADADAIQSAISLQYRDMGEIERQIQQFSPGELDLEEEARTDFLVETPIVRTVDLLITQAVKDGVSDIHIEPQKDHLRVRYRIDGILHDTMSLPLSVHPPLLSRIKVMADMNIAERRRFQDGNFSVTVEGRDVDVRAATGNTTWGEMAVLRLLDKAVSVLELPELGFRPEALARYREVLNAPFGMLLVSGPTGSGKTTTLYASINQMDRTIHNIMTIEDPVEYKFRDINQMEVNRRADVTFASGLRATMRLDPDIILVGEIRDQETAQTAVQAALTGHLVLSTVHANDAVGVIYRMMDLGIEPFLLNSSVVSVVAQRLVRTIHDDCRVTQEAAPEARRIYEETLGEERETFAYGEGCPFCNYIGYKGRTAVYEILVMTEDLRRLIIEEASAGEIREKAREQGMVTILEDGMLKVKDGLTTPDEVLRNVHTIV